MAPNIATYLSFFLILADESTSFAPNDQSARRWAALDAPSTAASRCRRSTWSPPRRREAACPLYAAKNNDRARMENSWEHMMGEDWREFRAHLVAREHAAEDAVVRGPRGQAKEEGVGRFLSGALSSMFSKGDTATATETKRREGAVDIFDGDGVGGATRFSKIGASSPCADPFMDEEECHLMYDEPDVSLDKHRWAHPLFHVEPGCILVANEKLGGVFHQTIVLIINHNEATGSTGMVINRPFPGTLANVASDTESNINLSLKMAFQKAPVSYGGPVMQDQFSTLHGFGEVMGSKKVCPGVFVGGSSQLMQEVRRQHLHPDQVLFAKGHAAWVPGQLTREIEKGVWYVAAASSDLILRYAGAPTSQDDNPADLWADVLSCMGDKFETIAVSHSGRGDERMLP